MAYPSSPVSTDRCRPFEEPSSVSYPRSPATFPERKLTREPGKVVFPWSPVFRREGRTVGPEGRESRLKG